MSTTRPLRLGAHRQALLVEGDIFDLTRLASAVDVAPRHQVRLLERALAGDFEGDDWMVSGVVAMLVEHSRLPEEAFKLVLEVAGKRSDPNMAYDAVRRQDLSHDLQDFVYRSREDLWDVLAYQENLAPHLLGALIEVGAKGDKSVREALCRNPLLPGPAQFQYAEMNHYARENLALNPGVTPEVQRILASSEDGTQRFLAFNPNLTPEARGMLLSNDIPWVLDVLATRDDFTEEEARILSTGRYAHILYESSRYPWVVEEALAGDTGTLMGLAKNPHLTPEQYTLIQRELASDAGPFMSGCKGPVPHEVQERMWVAAEESFVLKGLVERLDASPRILHAALYSTDSEIRFAAAQNPSLVWETWMPAALAEEYDPPAVDDILTREHVPLESWLGLVENWKGSIEDLLEACRLTNR